MPQCEPGCNCGRHLVDHYWVGGRVCESGCTCSRHPSLEDIQKRFWSRVNKTSDCWLWTGSTLKNGYPRFSKDGKYQLAHRLAYEFVVGPIPAGLTLDHRYTCPKICVNPAHLRPATQKQNQENLTGAQKNNLSTGVRGVTWDKDRNLWMGKVKHNGRHVWVGRFGTIDEAEAAVISKRLELFTYNDRDREPV